MYFYHGYLSDQNISKKNKKKKKKEKSSIFKNKRKKEMSSDRVSVEEHAQLPPPTLCRYIQCVLFQCKKKKTKKKNPFTSPDQEATLQQRADTFPASVNVSSKCQRNVRLWVADACRKSGLRLESSSIRK